MIPLNETQHKKLQEFVHELSGFAIHAEEALIKIEGDSQNKGSLFSFFSERMIAIRGTAQQLNLPQIAHIAGLGEEIALKGALPDARSYQIRKCIGSLWDALTTIKYLLEHYTEETNEERQTLVNRLEHTLKALGGGRVKATTEEIEALILERKF